MTPSPRFWIVSGLLVAILAAPLGAQDPAASRALKLLEQARKSIPDLTIRETSPVELLLAIALAQGRAGDLAAAEAGFQEILNGVPNEGANVALAKARAGDLKGAIALAETLKNGWILEKRSPLSGGGSSRPASLRTHALERIAGLLSESRRWTEALAVVDLLPETIQEGHGAGGTSRQEALAKVASAQTKSGALAPAFMTAKSVKTDYYREEVLVEIVMEHLKRSEVKEARVVDETITYPYLKLKTLSAIAQAQAKAGDPAAAAEAFRKVISIASGLIRFRAGPSSSVSALVGISAAQLATGDREAAQKTLDLAMKRSEEPDAQSIAVGLARLGAIDAAVAKADSIPVPWRRAYALLAIAGVLAPAANRVKVEELCSKARSIFQTDRDDPLRHAVLLEVGKAQLGSGLVPAALELAKEMDYRLSEKGDLLQLIVKAQVAAGDLKGARSTADLHSLDWLKALSYREIALALARGGDGTSAAELMDSNQTGICSISLEEISSLLVDRGELKLAREIALRCEMTDNAGRALRKVAFVQTSKGDEAGALAWASVQEGHLRKAHALLGVAEGILEVEARTR